MTPGDFDLKHTRVPETHDSANQPLTRRRLLALSSMAGGTLLLSGCGFGGDSKPSSDLIAWPLKNQWPARLEAAHPEIQEAYHYATTHKDVLKWFPCTCGCVDTDQHTSNFDCYVKEERDDGSVELDLHSFG